MALIVAAVLFIVYFANVLLGSMGSPTFLSDVQEMIVLFASSIAFVVGILKREAIAKSRNNSE